jgi:hypothetical protein
MEVRMRTLGITPETAVSLRELLHRAEESYVAYEKTIAEMRNRCRELAGPVHVGEIAALCKGDDRIEVVTHADYLNEQNKGRWY